MMEYCIGLGTAIALAMGAGGAAAFDRSGVGDAGLREFLAGFERGTERFMNGDPAAWKANVSRRDDVMIMGAWGAYEKGWDAVSARYDWAAARFRDADARLSVEYLTAIVGGDLAVTTAIERAEVRLAGQEQAAPMALRVTHVFRNEEGGWKLVLRHADPLVEKTAPETVLRK
jgi:ketosteroid isomerase-like protein